MSLVLINNAFISVLIVALIISIIDRKTKQACWMDLLSVLGATLGISVIATTEAQYTIEEVLFRGVMCSWVVIYIIRKVWRSHK